MCSVPTWVSMFRSAGHSLEKPLRPVPPRVTVRSDFDGPVPLGVPGFMQPSVPGSHLPSGSSPIFLVTDSIFFPSALVVVVVTEPPPRPSLTVFVVVVDPSGLVTVVLDSLDSVAGVLSVVVGLLDVGGPLLWLMHVSLPLTVP